MSDYYKELEKLAFSTDNVGYFYRVEGEGYVLIPRKENPEKIKTFEVQKDFKGDNLLQCRKDAVRYFVEQLLELDNLSLSSQSISLLLIDVGSDRDNQIILIGGESLEGDIEGQIKEAMIFKKLKDKKPKVEPLSYNRVQDIEDYITDTIKTKVEIAFAVYDVEESEKEFEGEERKPFSEESFEFIPYVDKLQQVLGGLELYSKVNYDKYIQEKIKALT